MARREKYDLQIRGVPADVRDRLRKRAARKGVSMSKYVIDLLEFEDLPLTVDDWLGEIRQSAPVPGVRPGAGAEAIRGIRDAVDRAVDGDGPD